MSAEPQVVTVQGEGGAVWDMDVPRPGSLAAERFSEQLTKGQLVIIAGEIPVEPSVEPAGDPPAQDLEDLTVAELKAYADERGVDLGDATKKADIIDVIEAAASDDEGDDLP